MNLMIFAGTYEGRKLSEFFGRNNIRATVCVATAYGKDLLKDIPNIKILDGRMDEKEISDFIAENKIDEIIDATHPYAHLATANIKNAAKNKSVKYQRVVREEKELGEFVKNTKDAVSYLEKTAGNILVTTGSKEISEYTKIKDFSKRLFVRVLPSADVIETLYNLGFAGRNIIAMQGPFSYEMNLAMLKDLNCKYMVSKNTGSAGGFEEKLRAAEDLKVKTILIGRPEKEEGFTLDEMIKFYSERLNLEKPEEFETKNEFFPIFVNSTDKKILVIGGGKIAERRIKTLLKFKFKISLVSPTITETLKNLAKNGEIEYFEDLFCEKYLINKDYIIAATDKREVNEQIGRLSKTEGTLVNIADKKEECDFYFPSVVTKDCIVVGLTAQGRDHGLLKKTADDIRDFLQKPTGGLRF